MSRDGRTGLSEVTWKRKMQEGRREGEVLESKDVREVRGKDEL